MILLRFLSLLTGALVLVVPPLFLFSGTSGPGFFDGATVLVTVAGLALAASSFFFIGFAAGLMRRSARLRMLGAALLAVPFAASVTMLWRATEPDLLWLSGLLLCFTVVLFLMILFPDTGAGKHRALRAREARLGQLARG